MKLTRKQTVRWFQDQWEKSNLISGTLAMGIWGTIVALALMGREPPDVLIGAGGIIIGFFFRSKTDNGG